MLNYTIERKPNLDQPRSSGIVGSKAPREYLIIKVSALDGAGLSRPSDRECFIMMTDPQERDRNNGEKLDLIVEVLDCRGIIRSIRPDDIRVLQRISSGFIAHQYGLQSVSDSVGLVDASTGSVVVKEDGICQINLKVDSEKNEIPADVSGANSDMTDELTLKFMESLRLLDPVDSEEGEIKALRMVNGSFTSVTPFALPASLRS